ncbi:MAG TPA: glycosyltransferase family 4 protein [Nitrososphaerales archaeon]|nr:glycosyltransferase family 4 protein [Nitrososphaerales archaeon]
MKVLMISGVFYPKINGAVIAVSNMMRSLSARGNQVTLVTRRDKGSAPLENWNGAKVVRVGRPGYAVTARVSLGFEQFRAALKIARADPPDVIHAHGFTSLLAGAALGISIGRPVVVSFHGIQRLWSAKARWRSETTLQFMLPFEKILLKLTRRVLSQSELLKGIVLQVYGVPSSKVTVVPNPIDVRTFKYGLPQQGDRPIVLFVGSLMKVHGPDVLLDSMPSVLRSHPEAKAVLVGKGPLRGPLMERIAELGLGDSAEMLDEIRDPEELSEVYRTSRVVVIPLRYTGYILSLVGEEAMASGRPVVTTMTLDEELSDFGVLKAGGTGDSLGDVISSVLSWDDARYEQVSRSAREYAEKRFSFEAVGGQLERIYKEVILNASGNGRVSSAKRSTGAGSSIGSVIALTRSLQSYGEGVGGQCSR